MIPIVIPTHRRPGGATYDFFREFNPYVIVRDQDSVPPGCPPSRVILETEPGITPARNAAVVRFPQLIMLDDDFRFSYKDLPGRPSPQDVYSLLATFLEEVPYVGMGMRLFCNRRPGWDLIRKPLGVFGLNQELYPDGFHPRFRLRIGEDMDYAFQLLQAGIPLITVNHIVRQDVPGQVHGKVRPEVNTGCNDWRTDSIIAEDNEELRRLWPGYIDSRGVFQFARFWKDLGHGTDDQWRIRAMRAELKWLCS